MTIQGIAVRKDVHGGGPSIDLALLSCVLEYDGVYDAELFKGGCSSCKVHFIQPTVEEAASTSSALNVFMLTLIMAV